MPRPQLRHSRENGNPSSLYSVTNGTPPISRFLPSSKVTNPPKSGGQAPALQGRCLLSVTPAPQSVIPVKTGIHPLLPAAVFLQCANCALPLSYHSCKAIRASSLPVDPSTGSEPAPYSIRGRTDDDHYPLLQSLPRPNHPMSDKNCPYSANGCNISSSSAVIASRTWAVRTVPGTKSLPNSDK